MSDNTRFPGDTAVPVSRRRFLQTALMLTGGTVLATSFGCGGSDTPPIVTPLPSPTPTRTTIALPQEYRSAYRLAEGEPIQKLNVTKSGDVIVAPAIYTTEQIAPAGISRYTNFGKPGSTERLLVIATPGVIVGGGTYFAITPSDEIYVSQQITNLSENVYEIAVVSLQGKVVRTFHFEFPESGVVYDVAVGQLGDLFLTGERDIRRYGEDRVFRNIVLKAPKDEFGFSDSLPSPAILPGDIVWSASSRDDGFLVANADGSGKRTVPFDKTHFLTPPRITRSDNEGNLYINTDLPSDYPNVPWYVDTANTSNKAFVLKYTQDGTLLAAINTGETLGTLQDFDVDPAGNVYIATGGGVSVYQRVR